MRRLFPSGLAGAAAIALTAIMLGSAAFGYFSATGSGTASAAVTTLTTSTLATPTPGGGTVSLSWSAATAPGTGTVTYYVKRDGGAPAGTCPTSTSPTAVTSCVDSGVSVGSHTYTVTAVWRSWTTVSTSKSATVASGPADHFTIAASSTTPAAAASVNLTITAKDENGITVTTYTGSKNLTFSGATASPGGTQPTVVNSSGTATNFGTATALTFTSGVAAVSSSKNGVMKIYDAGEAEIDATDGTISAEPKLSLVVSPLALSKYTVAAETTTPTAGAGDDLTVTALDTYGNTATAYTGSKSIVFSGPSNAPDGTVPTVSNSSGTAVAIGSTTALTFVAGVADAAAGKNGEMKIYKSGSASIKATEGSVTTPTALAVTVAPGTASEMTLASSSTTPVAAASVNLTLTAKDAYENTATAYTGSKNITFSGAEASPSGAAATVVNSAGTQVNFGTATALTFTSGVAAVASSKNGLLRLNKAGSASVVATDGTLTTAGLAFTVSVGTAARYGVIEVTKSAGTITQPCLFTCTITSLGNSGTVTAKVAVTDSVGNTVSGLGTANTVKITTTGGTISGTPLTIATTGAAVSTASFTYTAPSSGSYSNVITIARNSGTTYTSATVSPSK